MKKKKIRIRLKHHIIRILTAVVAGFSLMTSCTSADDPDPSVMALGEEMTFEVKTATRAVITDNDNVTESPFRVYGDVSSGDVYFEGVKTIFDGISVTYDPKKSPAAWNYGTTQYWLMGQKHSFVAMHPYDVEGISDLDYSDSKLRFKYTLPKEGETGSDEASGRTGGMIDLDSRYVKDILVATHRRRYDLDRQGAVEFQFKHLLARIDIKPALHEDLMYEDSNKDVFPNHEDEYILFHKIEIMNILTEAEFEIEPEETETSTYDAKVTQTPSVTQTGTGNRNGMMTIDFGKSPVKVTNNNTPVSIFGADSLAVLVLPQQFPKDHDAKIRLSYSVNDDDRRRNIIIPLADSTWEQNKIYTYRFTVSKAYAGQIAENFLEVFSQDDYNTEDSPYEHWIYDPEKDITFGFRDDGTWGPVEK